MLQSVNDCNWSPKPRRDDVPVTSAPRHVALPELKHCEVPDSVLSIVSTLHYASLHLAVHCRAIRATLHSSCYSALLRANPCFPMLRCASLCYAVLLYATLHCSMLRCATWRSYDTQGYTALLYDILCSTAISALLCTSLRFSVLLCTKLHSYDATLYCASTVTLYTALL